MQNRNIRRFIYKVRHDYATTNNVVLAVALVISASWALASAQAIQKNFMLQRQVDDKKRQQKLLELQAANLEFEQRYFKSSEYISLEAKRRLGLAEPGEKLLVLPPNSQQIKAMDRADEMAGKPGTTDKVATSNFQQWMNFLFGAKPRL